MGEKLSKSDGRDAKAAEREPPRAALDRAEDGVLSVQNRGDWSRICEAAENESVAEALLSQASVIGSEGQLVDPKATDFALGFVDAMRPQDAAEALLLTQMAATHQATMMLARRLNSAENIPQQDAAEKALNKTARTYAAQMDTLKRYRSKGQQVVRVERVTVEEGGQAIVGAVSAGRGREER